jgi:hypothetical protein
VRNRFVIAACLALVLAVDGTVGAGTASAAKPAPILGRIPIDATTCAMLIGQTQLTKPVSDKDCWGEFEAESQSSASALGEAVVASTTCDSGHWMVFNLYVLGIAWFKQHTNFGLCWNGSTIWRNWGPDCYGDGSVLIFSGTDQGGWCGVYNNGGTFVEPGANFWVSAYSAPWAKRWGWIRYHYNAHGQLTSVNGSCCS